MTLVALVVALAACGTPVAPRRPADRTQLARLESSVDLDGNPVGTAGGVTIAIVFASWCQHCHAMLEVLAKLRPNFPTLRVIGVNYRDHEEYRARGDAGAVRRYVTTHAPWLRVIPADEALFALLGRPSLIPTLYVYDRAGTLVEIYSRRERAMPDGAELRELLRRIGASADAASSTSGWASPRSHAGRRSPRVLASLPR